MPGGETPGGEGQERGRGGQGEEAGEEQEVEGAEEGFTADHAGGGQ